ncbi:uncharacterized protein LOC126793185 [Argentina anserina]|uniref:uncharacterized protein LOC126793185 n=1 Tax=Argentina anserina TaxID=57926 RepID=UPI00217661F4|nr:uncharacterized protein LOC126793185 [Potentilla anserina]
MESLRLNESDPTNPFDRKSDGDGDALTASPPSRYSSFGQSEYDRYCSANSVMGTPSMCSTVTVFNDFPEPDFGSVRSLGFGEDGGGGVEGFSLGGRSVMSNREDRRLSSSGGIEFSREDSIRGRPGDKYGSSGLELYGNEDDDIGVDGGDANELMSWKLEKSGPGLMEGSELKCGSDDSEEENVEGRRVVGKDSVGLDCVLDRDEPKEVGSGSRMGMEVEERCLDGGEVEREEGASSRNEYSEDEGSMYNYGTDDEPKSDFYHQHHEQSKPKNENENPFLMNSSVAFGSDDWDDFMQESEQSNVDFSTKSVFQDRRELNVESEGKGLNSGSVDSQEGTCQTEQEKDVTGMPRGSVHVEAGNNLAKNVENFREPAKSPNFAEPGVEDVRDIPVASYQVQAIDDLIEVTKSSITTPTDIQNVQEPEQEDLKNIVLTMNKISVPDESSNYPKAALFANFSKIQLNSEAKEAPEKKGFNIMVDDMSDVHTCTNTEVTGIDDGQDLGNKNFGKIKVKLDPLSEISTDQLSIHSTGPPESTKAEFFEDHKPNSPTLFFENNMTRNAPVSKDLFEKYPMPLKTDNLELNEFDDEFVNDMEEILLDSAESPGARFSHGNRNLQSQLSLPLRDGGSTASTSGTDDAYLFNQHSLRIDGVEVVGARQKKGDVSFSERLVGVKEYTVYKMRVWSGKNQWEIERRYRDFFTLYHRLKTLFADHGWNLPSPWSAVEKESRRIFGNASPDVIAERSILIQECLQSVLHYRFFSNPPSALIWFLSPQDSLPSSISSNAPDSVNRRADTENVSTFGKTISLIVEVQPYKSVKQMLEAQHYMCAGCHKHFDDGKTLIRDFALTFGWGKPRLCEYTGQLFCSSCHTNEIAVLPARVLHHWDFTQYSVSQLAKSYLDSIHDQPMLCVSAVNPFLFSKVPALRQVMGVRKKIGAMLPYVRCPFRRSINKGLGSRKYLLESNDFFALRDLIDLSKGAFAVLPVMVETVSRKILGHITEQCLICCDVGVPCGARQACNDPSSLIFPFQENEIVRCPSCESVFHNLCFKKLTNCPCGEQLRADEPAEHDRRASSLLGLEVSGVLDLFGKGSGSGLLSGLFSKVKTDNSREHKDGDNVILLGSFPPTSL